RPPNAKHSVFYRNPLPMADGKLIAAHSTDTHIDKNLGTRGNPSSRYSFRLQTMKLAGGDWVADQYLTTGISKTVTYWDPDTLVHFSGTLWELDPVEVRVRQRPARRTWALPSQEQKVFADQGVDEYRFRQFLKDSSL